MERTFIQVRTSVADKEQASAILENLGTNLSSVVNMLLKQIILTKSIPFEVSIPQAYTTKDKVAEVKASMAMEHMPLTDADLLLLETYQTAPDRDNLRAQLLAEYREVQ